MDIDPAQLREAPSKLFQTIGEFSLPGGFVFSPTYLQAGVIVFCLFLLLLSFAMLRRRQSSWTVKGVMPGVAFGFTLALFLEAMLLVGGRTLITETLGWKDAPKPISNALDVARTRLVEVLGVTAPVPESIAARGGVEEVFQTFENLSKEEQESLVELICR